MWNKKIRTRKGIVFAVLLSAFLPLPANTQSLANDCIIMPSASVDLSSPVPGQLESVLVDRSDSVTAGQVVATLDSRVEEANLAIARFHASTDTELRLREAVHAIDLRNEKRLRSLKASKLISAQESDRAVRDARLSAWRTRQAKDDLKLHKLKLTRAEAALERRNIRSPIAGVVLARLHDPGEYIEGQPLLRIVKLDPLHVEAILPMRLFGKVKPGMQANVIPEIGTGSTYQATVALVDPMGDAGSSTFGVRLTLPNPGHVIPAGVKCRVEIAFDGTSLTQNETADKNVSRIVAMDSQQKNRR